MTDRDKIDELEKSVRKKVIRIQELEEKQRTCERLLKRCAERIDSISITWDINEYFGRNNSC